MAAGASLWWVWATSFLTLLVHVTDDDEDYVTTSRRDRQCSSSNNNDKPKRRRRRHLYLTSGRKLTLRNTTTSVVTTHPNWSSTGRKRQLLCLLAFSFSSLFTANNRVFTKKTTYVSYFSRFRRYLRRFIVLARPSSLIECKCLRQHRQRVVIFVVRRWPLVLIENKHRRPPSFISSLCHQ